MKKTKIIWFTGLSGSGKSTIATILVERFKNNGLSFEVLDGDDVRERLHKHLGFSREDILENNRLILELCKNDYGKVDFILVPVISPFKISRENARTFFKKDFIEVYLDCPYEECKRRDVKGLYKKAEIGELKNFIGLHHPYEIPDKPEIKLDVVNKKPQSCAEQILKFIKVK